MFDQIVSLVASWPEWVRFFVAMAMGISATLLTWATALVLHYWAFAGRGWSLGGRWLVGALGTAHALGGMLIFLVFWSRLPAPQVHQPIESPLELLFWLVPLAYVTALALTEGGAVWLGGRARAAPI